MSGWDQPEASTHAFGDWGSNESHAFGEWGSNERDSSSSEQKGTSASSTYPPHAGGTTVPSIASRRQQAPHNQAVRSARGNPPRGSSSSSSSTLVDVSLSLKSDRSRYDVGDSGGTGSHGGGWIPTPSASEVPQGPPAFDQQQAPWGVSERRGDTADKSAYDNSAKGSWSINQADLNLESPTQDSGGSGGWFASEFEPRSPANLKPTTGARDTTSSSSSFRPDATPYEPLDSVTSTTKTSMAESSRRRKAQGASKVSPEEEDFCSSAASIETESWNPEVTPSAYSRWAPEGYVPPPVKYPMKVLRQISSGSSVSPPPSTASGHSTAKAASSPVEGNDPSAQIGFTSPPPSPSLSKLRNEMFKPSDADTTRPRSDQATRDMFTVATLEQNSRIVASIQREFSESDLAKPGCDIKLDDPEKMLRSASLLDTPPHLKLKAPAQSAPAARGWAGTSRGDRVDVRQRSSPIQESPPASVQAESPRTQRSTSLGFVESPKPLEASASNRSATGGGYGSPDCTDTTSTKVGSLGADTSSSTSALHGMKGLMDHLREMYAEKLELQSTVRSLERDLTAQHQRTSIAEAQARVHQHKAHDFEIRLLEAFDKRALLGSELENLPKQNQELRQRNAELVTAAEERATAEMATKSATASKDPDFDKHYKELEAAKTALEKDKTALLADRSNLVTRLNASELDRASLTGRLLVAQQDAMEMGNQLALEQRETARSQKVEAAMVRENKSHSTEKEEAPLVEAAHSSPHQKGGASRRYSQDELLALRTSPLIEQHALELLAAAQESRDLLASAPPERTTFSNSDKSPEAQVPSFTDTTSRNGTDSQ
ncbi:BZ3500_MvSof-1268-A1-R1_Chr2-1g04220 [Microbotryum saponariae]|uniref:BZ3500_MvSof-1268-A1-R1_Chr2-1g04220 protein n=1 Tax=Microbotryum saponariae TaxID=289078 RepID=A0A2X0MAN3_9BASI|nr:BZ3500_MvSof-1268-A1-R1_Chr2-1g04220 [Microbotryum saponariae]SCZ91207.1 BZ3501_MvSof-1269-A2-R1_Chr2-1g03876 [Microbotryum saponariae]